MLKEFSEIFPERLSLYLYTCALDVLLKTCHQPTILKLSLSSMSSKCRFVNLVDCVLISSTGYDLLHPLVFTRLFPTLITLYVLHHEDTDTCYQRGLDFLRSMDEDRVAAFIRFPESVMILNMLH